MKIFISIMCMLLAIASLVCSSANIARDTLPEDNDYLETFVPRFVRSLVHNSANNAKDALPEDSDYLETFVPRFVRSTDKRTSHSSSPKFYQKISSTKSTPAGNQIQHGQSFTRPRTPSHSQENQAPAATAAYTDLMTPSCASIAHPIGQVKAAPTLSEITGQSRLPANFYDQIAHYYFGSSPFVRTYPRTSSPAKRHTQFRISLRSSYPM